MQWKWNGADSGMAHSIFYLHIYGYFKYLSKKSIVRCMAVLK